MLIFSTQCMSKCIAADIAALVFCGGVQVERYDINGIYALLAATIKRAQWDAKRGDKQAIRWLQRFLDGVYVQSNSR